MSEIPEVFAIFEQKLAHVLSFNLRQKGQKKAIEELLVYFSGIVERASKAESRIAELEAENAELKERAENAEQMVSRLLEVGSALEAQAYDAWIKDGMLDFPAAKDWELLINEIKETKKESEK